MSYQLYQTQASVYVPGLMAVFLFSFSLAFLVSSNYYKLEREAKRSV